MGMFSTEGETRRKPGAGSEPKEPRFSVVAGGMRVTGEVVSDSVIKIEGTVEGNLRAEGQVLVAKGGLVLGDIFTGEAIVGGEVRGSIHAFNRVEVQAGSVVNGDITAPQIMIHEGGEINGVVQTRRPEAADTGPEIALEPPGDLSPGETAEHEIPDYQPVGASAGPRSRWR